MSFDNTIDFKDHIVQYPNRFKQTTVAPGVVELVPTWITNSDEIIEPGTPVDSELFEKLKQNVTIYQQTFTTTENQTVINLNRDFLVGQNRVSLSIGGVRHYTGQDYMETDTHTLTMTTPLKGGLKAEVIMFTASQAIAEDFFEKTVAAIAATQAANNAAQDALDAATKANNSTLNWRTPIDTFSQITLISNPENRDTVMTRDTGKVYRYNGTTWLEIQDIDPTVINAVDTRLTAQLAEKASQSMVSTLDSKVATERKREQQSMRRGLDLSSYRRYTFPTDFGWKSAPIKLFTNGTKFATDFDVVEYRNVSTNTYWVDVVNGLNTNTGSQLAPFKTLEKAYQMSESGDTIRMKPGIYYRDSSWQSVGTLQKSLNIIGDGEVIIPLSDKHTYTKTAGQMNVYQTARTNVAEVIDITFDLSGFKYEKKNTLADCDSSPGSYYTDTTTLFVHTLNSKVPNVDKMFPLLSSQHFKVNNALASVKLYLENLTIFGGNNGNLWLDRINASYGLSVYAKGCDFLHSTGLNGDGDAVNIDGADEAFFQDCRALHGRKDGFNYTSYNSASALVATPKFIEVNCVGAYNGIPNILSPNTNNGSTSHAGTKGIRVNGQYYKNMGANVADVQPGTETLNLSCIAFDSLTGLQDQTDSDFAAQQSGAKMWLDGCISFGSKYNLYALSGTQMIVSNTQFDSKQGSGQFIISNQL